MGSTINSKISAFFGIFIPITYIFFILAGFISALVSAFIEYQVFAELYQKSIITRGVFLSIPFLVVFAFETTKVFLIFLNEQYTKSGNKDYIDEKSHFLRLRYALIFISIISTLIFSFYNLHNPEYDTVYENTKGEIESKYNSLVDEVNSSYDNDLKSQVAPISRDIQSYDTKMTTEEDYKYRGRQEYRGPRYNEAKKLRAESIEKRNEFISKLNKERRTKIYELREQQNSEIGKIKDDLKTSSASGNKMLLSTLQIMNMKVEFPQWQYILIIFILSFLLSIGLEYIIWAAFTLLAINHGDIFELDINSKNWVGKHKIVKESIDDMDNVEVNSYIKRTNKWLKSIFNRASKMAKHYRDDINNIVK